MLHPRRFGFLVFCAIIVAGPAGLYPLANFERSGRFLHRGPRWPGKTLGVSIVLLVMEQ